MSHRSATTGASLADRVRAVVEQDKVQLPPLPELALKLKELLVDENRADARRVTELVQNEPAVVASLLRCANSAAYGGLREISDLNQAIARLGLGQVSTLVTALQLKGNFATERPERNALLHRIWDHSIASAHFCRRLAERAGIDADEAFLTGLLHDIGRLLVFRAVDHLENENPALTVTQPVLLDLMNALHTSMVGGMLERWKLPESIRLAAEQHHREERDDDPLLLTIVQAADAMSRKLGAHLDPDPDLDVLGCPAVERLELRDLEIATMMVDLEDELEEIRGLF